MAFSVFSLSLLASGFGPADIAAAVLCIALIALMIRAGVMDHPVARSSHTRPVPKGGGIGIVGAFLLCLPFAPGSLRTIPLTGLETGVALLAAVSWLDDLRPFRARYKLAAQFASAFILAVTVLPGAPPLLIAAFTPGAILGAVFLTNALNFIDGINGLASGVMLIAAIGLAGAGIAPGAFVLLAVGLLCFLPWNFPKARIFMGDVGSQAGALVLAWGGMTGWPEYGFKAAFFVAALLSGVIWDVLFTLARRARAGDNLAQAHRGHLYQLAVRSGLPVTWVTPLYWLSAVWGGLTALTFPPVAAALLIVLPQIGWTAFICARARKSAIGRW